MADSLPPEIRRRLGLILARMASNHDGEVLNAARLAVKMLAEHGWRPEYLAERLMSQPGHRSAPPPPPPQPDDEDTITDAAAFAAALLAEAVGLSARERAFLEDLVTKQWGRATEKQTAWLRSIAKKMPASAGRKYGT